MRTTIDLDPTVLRELKQRSQDSGKSMGEVASELLARSLHDAHDRHAVAAKVTWIAKDLGRPRVDLEDKEALRAILDSGR